MQVDATRTAMESTAARFPPVMWGSRWLVALHDQLFLVLLCLLALMPGCFLVYVMVLGGEDLCKPGRCMLVDQLVVLIQHLLPLSVLAVARGTGLHNDPHWCGGMLGKGYKTCKESSGLGLGIAWDARDCPQPLELANSKERSHLLLSHDRLWSSTELHRQFQEQWRVMELEGFFLEFAKLDGVIEGGHIHQDCDSMVFPGFMDFLSKQSF